MNCEEINWSSPLFSFPFPTLAFFPRVLMHTINHFYPRHRHENKNKNKNSKSLIMRDVIITQLMKFNF